MSAPLARLSRAPVAALVLGFGGLLPFVWLTMQIALRPEWGYAYWLAMLAQYGAVILAFIGALQWGYAIRDGDTGSAAWLRYGIGVLPALGGWASLQTPVWTALQLQAVMLLGLLALERTRLKDARAPEWLAPLRYVLTTVAAGCLAVASVV